MAFYVFTIAGLLADNEKRCMRAAFTEYSLCAGAP
jgi:hypothetical protein